MTVATGRDRREEILAIAGGLFAEHGYHGTSIRHIAAAAQLQSATLYSHFRNKPAMFRELIDRYFDALLPALTAAADGPGDAAARLTTMTRQSVEIGCEHREAFIALSNDWRHIRSSEELAGIVGRRNEATALWSSVLQAAVEEGSVRAHDTSQGAALWIVYASITGMVDDRYDAVAGPEHRREPPTGVLLQVLERGLWGAGPESDPTTSGTDAYRKRR